MKEHEVLKAILDMVQQINPNIKSISSNDKLYGIDSTWGLSSIEVAILLVNIEDHFGVIIDSDVMILKTIIDCICERF